MGFYDSFYGSLVEDPAVLARLDHPVYGTFAAMDQGIPPDQVERFAAALFGQHAPRQGANDTDEIALAMDNDRLPIQVADIMTIM